ncbi:MAG: 4Fe-4S binding protein [Pseudomonadota bacterium]
MTRPYIIIVKTMCEFCTKHGDGKIWYKNAANYAQDLVADLKRKKYIQDFFESTINDGFKTLGRLEVLFARKGRLPASITDNMEQRAKIEHFGQVLPMEEIKELVLKAETITRMPCACRWAAHKKEVRCCYAISYGPCAWYEGLDMTYFGKPSDEGFESLSHHEALHQMGKMEEDGAIHTIWTMLTPFIGAVCNCTTRDCIAMRTLSGIRVETIARAEHVAVVDRGLCEGCGLCAERCQFHAIDSIQEDGRTIARIDSKKCFGCGLCRRACTTGALSLVLR